MKIISFIATLTFHFLSVFTLKLLDNFSIIIGIFLASLVGGFIIKYSSGNSKTWIKNTGWGLIYGSLTSIGLLISFVIWATFNWPK